MEITFPINTQTHDGLYSRLLLIGLFGFLFTVQTSHLSNGKS